MKRSMRFRPPLLMVGVLVLAMLACSFSSSPTSAPAYDPTKAALEQMATAASIQLTQVSQGNQQVDQPPTEPPAANVPPTAVPPTALPPTTAAGQQFFTEGFDTDSGLWSHFTVDATVMLTSPGALASVVQGDSGNMSVKVEDGHLAFDLQSKGLWVYATYDGAEYTDVKMEAVADNRGTNDNNVSLICRYSKEHGWYEFNVANSGLYDILFARVTPDNKVSYSRIADGGSNKINQGKQTNIYGIICKGRSLTLTINGFETRRIVDNQFVLDKGKVGISVSSFNSLPVTVLFDSVTLSQP